MVRQLKGGADLERRCYSAYLLYPSTWSLVHPCTRDTQHKSLKRSWSKGGKHEDPGVIDPRVSSLLDRIVFGVLLILGPGKEVFSSSRNVLGIMVNVHDVVARCVG